MAAKVQEDLTGQTFNSLRVVGPAQKTRRGWEWPCVCIEIRDGLECGNRRMALTNQLRQGGVKMCHSCGQQALRAHRSSYGKLPVMSHGGMKMMATIASSWPQLFTFTVSSPIGSLERRL